MALPAATLQAGYRIEAQSGRIRTRIATGIARQRKRVSTPPQTVAASWVMTGEQLAFFKSWVEHKIAFGASFFNIDLALDEAGTESVEARLKGDARYRLIRPGLWRVEADLELKAPIPLSSDVVDLILALGDELVLALAAELQGVSLAPAFAQWEIGFGQ